MQEIKKINLSLEWKYEKLGKLCSFDKEGVNPKEDIKYYHYSFPAFDNNKEPEVEVGKDIKSSKFLFNKGDILFNKLNVKFKRVWDIDFDIDENSICSTEFIPIQAKNIDRNFLYYCLISPNFTNEMKYLSTGTSNSHQRINPKDIKDYDLFLPTDEEIQKKIGYILKLLDKKISMNVKINKNLEEQIETIYNSFFVYYDDFSKEELEECEIGLIPKDWKLMSLGEVTTKIKEKVGSDDYKVFSAVNTGNLILSEEYFDKQVYSKNIEKYIVVKQKEFAYNPARINIGSIGRNDFNYDGCVSPVYVAFKVEEGYENFMNMYIKSNRFNQWVVTLSSGSVRQTLNYADFSIIKIAYPPKDLVNKFNKVYDNYYEVINYNNSVISNLENIRDTLLPKLMSGEIDVSKINCDLKIIIRKIYIKSSKLFLWRYLSENKNYIKNTKSNETLLKSRTIYKINKFLAKFNARYRYYRQ